MAEDYKELWKPPAVKNMQGLQEEIMVTLGLVQRHLGLLKEFMIFKVRWRCYMHRLSFHSVTIFLQ